MTITTLTQIHLKNTLQYNPLTGIFTNKKKGLKAGTATDQGYVRIGIDNNYYKAHRLAFLYMLGLFPSDQVDHINGNRSDNRWLNLRSASNAINQKNRKTQKNNTSKVTGISWSKERVAWEASIRVNKRRVSLGRHSDWFEAVCARMSANNKYDFHPNHGRR